MSDDADFAEDRIQKERERAIRAASQVQDLPATGSCLFCDEPVGEGRRFCGPECRDGWDQEKRVRARQGAR